MSPPTPVILEVALNGLTTPEQNPAAPRQPEEIAKDALACFAAGAAIVHTHSDDPLLPPEQGAATSAELDAVKVAVEVDAPESPEAEAEAEVEVDGPAPGEAMAPQGDVSATTPEPERDEPKPEAARDLALATAPVAEMLDVEAESPILPGSVEREES